MLWWKSKRVSCWNGLSSSQSQNYSKKKNNGGWVALLWIHGSGVEKKFVKGIVLSLSSTRSVHFSTGLAPLPSIYLKKFDFLVLVIYTVSDVAIIWFISINQQIHNIPENKGTCKHSWSNISNNVTYLFGKNIVI